MWKLRSAYGLAAWLWLAAFSSAWWIAPADLYDVKLRIVDAATGRPTPARVSIPDSGTQPFAPKNSVVRKLTNGQPYFYADGECSLRLPAGITHLGVSRGLEYLPEALDIEAETKNLVTVRLTRWTNMAERGWYSGDSHVHLHTGGPLRVDVPDALLAASAEGLNYTNLCVSNNVGDDIRDAELITGKPHELSDAQHLLVFGEEMRSSIYGHMQFFGIRTLVKPQYTGFDDTPIHRDYPPNYDQATEAIRQGGVVTYGHPVFAGQPDPFTSDPLKHNAAACELPIDAILGKTHAVDLMCYGSDEELSCALWHRLLNCGMRLAACAGTDALLDNSTNPLGGQRVYVKVNGKFTMQSWINGLKEGRTFVTNGPMVTLAVNDKEVGETIALEKPGVIQVRLDLQSYVPIEMVEIVVNGQVRWAHQLAARKPTDPWTTLQLDCELPLETSSWVAARVRGPESRQVIQGRARAHTSPVYATVAGLPIASIEDARYFVGWIDKLLGVVAARDRYANPEDRERVEELFKRAQAKFQAMAEADPK